MIDAHCHLDCQNLISQTELLKFWNENHYNLFISSISAIKDLAISIPGIKTLYTAGLHPYVYFEHLPDFDLSDIEEFIKNKQIVGIGECGLDKRYQNMEEQIKLLLPRLDIASQYDIPVVFHCVKAYYELAKILKNNFPKIRGILHGFTGNQEIIEIYKGFDIYISISSRQFWPVIHEKTLLHIIQTERYVFESDIEIHLCNQMQDIVTKYEQISQICDWICEQNSLISFEKLQQIQSRNIAYLFKIQI